MNPEKETRAAPEILAPAGNRAAFLAAVAAGAEAIYCGLKSFSARMEAKNFSLEELAQLIPLAHARDIRVYVTFNSLLKGPELERAGQTIGQLQKEVRPDALIVQDLAMVQLARQAGYKGELHLSTLTNVSFGRALKTCAALKGIDRVVLPRELNIDEMKAMAAACPETLALEAFIHGALCYGVSGRCYWSSYMGGRSSLRGRCVQPCRRLYSQKNSRGRHFSCQDLSLDVLVKVLKAVPQIRTWKIEGRKKGPHYVYYTVKAYQMLRDQFSDPQAKRAALKLLEMALGRPGTHYNFLPQRPQNPLNADRQTGSGFMVGKTKGPRDKSFLVPREELLPGDTLRVGYEDQQGHALVRVKKSVPRNGKFYLNLAGKKVPARGTPVFLTDRREKSLDKMIADLEAELAELPPVKIGNPSFSLKSPPPGKTGRRAVSVDVYRTSRRNRPAAAQGLWLYDNLLKTLKKGMLKQAWCWLPPVIWPQNEAAVQDQVTAAKRSGCRQFVLNAPWQMTFFDSKENLTLWAGPFCNAANSLAFKTLAELGFAGVVVSPELGRQEYLELPAKSPLPLGIVASGHWPLCVSRAVSDDIKTGDVFTSPRGEQGWVVKYDADYWVFPNWQLDLKDEVPGLEQAGYKLIINLVEPVPRGVKLKKRPGKWNWKIGLK